MDRARKEELVAALNQAFAETSMVVLSHFRGLSAAEAGELRRRMKDAGASFKVTKNRLTRRALVGTPYEDLVELFTGPTAIAYSADPVAAAKASVEFAKSNNKLVLVGGSLGGRQLDESGVKALAALPSLDELRARLVGMLNTPATRIAAVLQAPGAQVARVIAAYGDKDEAA